MQYVAVYVGCIISFGTETESKRDERQDCWVLKDIIRPVFFILNVKVQSKADLTGAEKKQDYLL